MQSGFDRFFKWLELRNLRRLFTPPYGFLLSVFPAPNHEQTNRQSE